MRLLCSLDGGAVSELSSVLLGQSHPLHYKDDEQIALQQRFLSSARNEFCAISTHGDNLVSVETLVNHYNIDTEAVRRFKSGVDDLFDSAAKGELSDEDSLQAIQLISYSESDFLPQLRQAIEQDVSQQSVLIQSQRQQFGIPKLTMK